VRPRTSNPTTLTPSFYFTSTMVVLKSTSPLSPLYSHFFTLSSLRHRRRHLHHAHPTTTRPTSRVKHFSVKAYMENSNSLGSFANRVIGALPVVGLIARILSDEGGVGEDLVDFAEFRRRVGKKCSQADSTAFYEFQDRRGRVSDPPILLLTPFRLISVVLLCQNRVFVIDQGWVVKQEFFT